MKNSINSVTSERKNTFFLMWQRELSIIRKMPSLFALVFVYPIVMMLIVFAIFNKANITQLPIAFVDQDQSAISRQLIQKISAVSEIAVTVKYSDLAEAKTALKSTKVYAVVLIPPYFEEKMLANQQPEITTFYNNQFMTIGSTLNRAIYTGLSAFIGSIQLEKVMNNSVPLPLATAQLKPVEVELHPLFNPTLSFIDTLVNGLYPTIMQIIIMFAIAASTQKEKSMQLSQGVSAFAINHPFRFLINKYFIYFIWFFISLLIFDLIMTSYFQVPIAGNVFLLLLGDVLFILAAMCISLAFSLLIKDKLTNYSVIGIICSPAFGYTGLIFPRIAMNTFAYMWGGLLPITWYVQIRLDQTLRGLPSIETLKPIGFLLLLIIIPLCLIRLKIKKSHSQGVA
ncbi:ABC transporter permease [Utexia brackfieldae]|uniref:ABC transporter permease n=1 Tax=Utexia brackfieldae TaxID=3074108 RepID=UPI00370DBB2B